VNTQCSPMQRENLITSPALPDYDGLLTQVPPHCVPIHANVTTYNWDALAAAAQFDVIMMDPPWALATANPSRGVSLGYRSKPCHDALRRSFLMPPSKACVLGFLPCMAQ